jgi:LPS O-antigen subunit length determinant protein (WzzB/FepE family)
MADWAEKESWRIWDEIITNDERLHVQALVATALREARVAALEEAAKIADAEALEHKTSTHYALVNVAAGIRSLKTPAEEPTK